MVDPKQIVGFKQLPEMDNVWIIKKVIELATEGRTTQAARLIRYVIRYEGQLRIRASVTEDLDIILNRIFEMSPRVKALVFNEVAVINGKA